MKNFYEKLGATVQPEWWSFRVRAGALDAFLRAGADA